MGSSGPFVPVLRILKPPQQLSWTEPFPGQHLPHHPVDLRPRDPGHLSPQACCGLSRKAPPSRRRRRAWCWGTSCGSCLGVGQHVDFDRCGGSSLRSVRRSAHIYREPVYISAPAVMGLRGPDSHQLQGGRGAPGLQGHHLLQEGPLHLAGLAGAVPAAGVPSRLASISK